MTGWVLVVIGTAALPILVALLARVAAAVPAQDGDPMRPRFPSWLRRSWLPAAMACGMAVVAASNSPSPTLALWSLAGPWAVRAFGAGIATGEVVAITILLVAGIGSFPLRPGSVTAVLCLLCGLCWFALGFGTVRIGV